jgi:hypothetical protein
VTLEHFPGKVATGFREKLRTGNKLERDDNSKERPYRIKRNHNNLNPSMVFFYRPLQPLQLLVVFAG